MLQNIIPYSVGSGSNGLLLTNSLLDESVPQQITQIDVTKSYKIKLGGLIGMYQQKNILFIYGQLDTIIKIPKQLNIKNVLKLSCGWHHALILCQHALYGIGSNKFYELSLEQKIFYDELQQIQFDAQKITDIQCGFRQSFLICEKETFGCGQNKFQELHLNQIKVAQKFQSIGVSDIVKLKCGQKFVLALKKNKTLVGWGFNGFGQLAEKVENQIIAYKELASNVIKFSCGWSHQVIVTQNGDTFICGRGDMGQQGDNQKQNNEEYKKIEIQANNVKCGTESTIIISKDQIFVTGWNEHGNLGLGHKDNVFEFTKIENAQKVKANSAVMIIFK